MRIRQWTTCLRKPLTAACIAAAACMGTAYAGDWENSSKHYEDDAWYDVTEWLDGNDYNPKGEDFWEWDNERYGAQNRRNERAEGNNPTDRIGQTATRAPANQRDGSQTALGYDDSPSYELSSQSDGLYGHTSYYYDYDGDGLYDAYQSAYDWDLDGTFEDSSYYTFADLTNSESGSNNQSSGNQSSSSQSTSNDHKSQSTNRDKHANSEHSDSQHANSQQAGNDSRSQQAKNRQQASDQSNEQKPMSSKRFTVSGDVEITKKLNVRNGENMLVMLKSDQRTIAVDIGSVDDASQFDIREGSTLTAMGPMTQVADRKVLLADAIQLEQGEKQSISRNGFELQGTVKSLKTTKVRGTEHQLAIVKPDTDSKKQVLVDLGPANKLPKDLSEGDEVTIKGLPIRAGDKPALLAKKMERNGQTTKIERRALNQNERKAEASS